MTGREGTSSVLILLTRVLSRCISDTVFSCRSLRLSPSALPATSLLCVSLQTQTSEENPCELPRPHRYLVIYCIHLPVHLERPRFWSRLTPLACDGRHLVIPRWPCHPIFLSPKSLLSRLITPLGNTVTSKVRARKRRPRERSSGA